MQRTYWIWTWGFFVLFCFYIFIHFLRLRGKEKFATTVRRLLITLGTSFFIYLAYFLMLTLKKDYFMFSGGGFVGFDVALFPMLCGFLVLLALLLFNKIQFFIANKLVKWIGIPFSILGAHATFMVLYSVPLTFIDHGRHAPHELIVIVNFFLIGTALYLGITILARKSRQAE